MSRTEAKLTAVATDIEARYGVQTKVVPADFAAMDDATWEALDAVLGSVPLGVLVNSAGNHYSDRYSTDFGRTPIHRVVEVLEVLNCP